MGVLLEVKNLGISFGGLRAVDGLNMTINEGALVGLIGPNGAGKTTAFNMLTGVYRPVLSYLVFSWERAPAAFLSMVINRLTSYYLQSILSVKKSQCISLLRNKEEQRKK